MNTIQRKMDTLTRDGVLPGCALRVRRGGEIVFDSCSGYADLENQIPVRPDTLYRICSMTKLVTAVAVMQLVERETISLDDSLLRFFPNYPASKAKITVRHLLSHCCGMGQGSIGERYMRACLAPEDTLATWIDKWGDMPLDCPVGTSAAYSPAAAFDLAGRVVEIATGQTLGEYITRNIAKPLGMKDTGFVVSDAQKPRRARLYRGAEAGFEPVEDARSVLQFMGFEEGCGALFSTLDDFDRFTTMLYCNGELDGARIISEETLWLMRTPEQITSDSLRPGQRWGLGFLIFEHPEWTGRKLGHFTYGWSGAFGTHMYIDPQNDLCVTLMAGREDIGGADSVASFALEEAIFESFCG